MTHYYFAKPYNICVPGFAFSDYDDYCAQMAALKADFGAPVEEVSFEYIDGDNEALFNALDINQATLEQWFDDLEGLDGDDLVKAIYLAEYLNANSADILDRLDEVSLFEGDAESYTLDFVEGCGLLDGLPENLHPYFDTEAFARDLLLGGDIEEVDIMGRRFVVWGC
tara:strand:- start:121 stop:624 length:504 start_codon:yes stop_codon:yes gene_type:complete